MAVHFKQKAVPSRIGCAALCIIPSISQGRRCHHFPGLRIGVLARLLVGLLYQGCTANKKEDDGFCFPSLAELSRNNNFPHNLPAEIWQSEGITATTRSSKYRITAIHFVALQDRQDTVIKSHWACVQAERKDPWPGGSDNV